MIKPAPPPTGGVSTAIAVLVVASMGISAAFLLMALNNRVCQKAVKHLRKESENCYLHSIPSMMRAIFLFLYIHTFDRAAINGMSTSGPSFT